MTVNVTMLHFHMHRRQYTTCNEVGMTVNAAFTCTEDSTPHRLARPLLSVLFTAPPARASARPMALREGWGPAAGARQAARQAARARPAARPAARSAARPAALTPQMRSAQLLVHVNRERPVDVRLARRRHLPNGVPLPAVEHVRVVLLALRC